MDINWKNIISVTEANQNFSKVAHMVEEHGEAIIFKRNKPKYMMLDMDNAAVINKAYRQITEWDGGRSSREEEK